MKKEDILKVIKELKEKSKKRNFKQSFDLIVVLKGLNLKKPEEQVEFFQPLKHDLGKQLKICALVGPELAGKSKDLCDFIVKDDEFPKYAKDKKATKKLAKECGWFIAQANLMPKIAASFGRVLGPKGKMPNPKAGCIVPPTANLKPLCDRLRKTVKVSAKTVPTIQCIVGKEDMKDEDVTDNIWTIYDGLVHHLPSGKDNVRNVLLKLTMGKPINLEK
ncbi:50S ribosomal protein L1 [Candidatus Woesearchaeota archaeon]|nr:50S ribosomal protein L1 [Candidatus Woesearchaeota archaeon]